MSGTQTHIPPAVEAKREQSQVETLANVPKFVTAFGREYQIKRFSLWQFACSLNYITPISALLQALVRSPAVVVNDNGKPLLDDKGNPVTDRTHWIPAIVGALSMSGDSMIGLISIATSEPLEWLQEEDKDPFEGIELLSVIVEKNLDFFSEKNINRLRALVEGLTPRIQELYGVASTISSAPGTTTTPSSTPTP